MQVLYGVCCGLDVHKKEITAALLTGAEEKAEVKEFGTTTNELREMVEWLKTAGCEQVAMESTGVYWKPVYNIFEMEGIAAMVVNASHMKAIPGRKTDANDAEWIADLLRHGLLKASFIPEKDQREYRELIRYRSSRIDERSREINRLQKMLEGANIKLASYVSNIMGKSAGSLLGLALDNKELTDEQIAEVTDSRLKASIKELKESLTGIISPLQRDLISMVLDIIADQSRQIADVEALISKYTKEAYEEAAKKLDVVPGIGMASAQAIVAEIGIDMSRFPTADHLCAWGDWFQEIMKAQASAKDRSPAKGTRL